MTEPSVTTVGQYPKARWWAAVGIVAVVLGAAASTVWFVWALGRVDDGVDDLAVFSGGEQGELTVTEPVDWTIYLTPAGRSLSGVRFEIVDSISGETVALAPSRNDVDYSVGSRSGRPVARAELDAGSYRVELAPNDATLAIGGDVGDRVQQMWLGAVLIGLPSVLGGGTVAAINLLRSLRGAPSPDAGSSEPGAAPTVGDASAPTTPTPPESTPKAPPTTGPPPNGPPATGPPPPPAMRPTSPPPPPLDVPSGAGGPDPTPTQPPPPDPRLRRDR